MVIAASFFVYQFGFYFFFLFFSCFFSSSSMPSSSSPYSPFPPPPPALSSFVVATVGIPEITTPLKVEHHPCSPRQLTNIPSSLSGLTSCLSPLASPVLALVFHVLLNHVFSPSSSFITLFDAATHFLSAASTLTKTFDIGCLEPVSSVLPSVKVRPKSTLWLHFPLITWSHRFNLQCSFSGTVYKCTADSPNAVRPPLTLRAHYGTVFSLFNGVWVIRFQVVRSILCFGCSVISHVVEGRRMWCDSTT